MSLPPILDLGDMPAPVTVTADLHLTAMRPETLDAFLPFLEDVRKRGGTLILLGDLFDWWMGPAQTKDPFAAQVLDGLRETAGAGVRLAFVAGNRDFVFAGAEGLDIEIWPDVVRARWGDKKVVLSHGDLLCTADLAYLAMRKIIRTTPMRWFGLSLPPPLRRKLAHGMRRASGKAQKVDPRKHLGIDYGEARRWLEGYDADLLVLGHVHQGVHHRLEGVRPRDVYVLKDWDSKGNCVCFDERGIRLVSA